MRNSSGRVVAQGALAVEVLSSPDFEVAKFQEGQQALADRLGLDLSEVIFTLDHIPLAQNGPKHKLRRTQVSQLILENSPDIKSRLPDIVLARMAPLTKGGRVDMLAAVILPLVGEVLTILTGTSMSDRLNMVSRTFSQSIGPGQRKRLQAELVEIRADLERQFPYDGEDKIGARMALLVLGRDALIGTLSRSLHAYFLETSGRALSEVPCPRTPVATGVPYIDREARKDVTVGDLSVAKGGTIRCQLKTLEQGRDTPSHRFFGAGQHVCLGRPISLSLFKEIAERLSTVPVAVAVVDFKLRKDDVFLVPDRFVVEVSSV